MRCMSQTEIPQIYQCRIVEFNSDGKHRWLLRAFPPRKVLQVQCENQIVVRGPPGLIRHRAQRGLSSLVSFKQEIVVQDRCWKRHALCCDKFSDSTGLWDQKEGYRATRVPQGCHSVQRRISVVRGIFCLICASYQSIIQFSRMYWRSGSAWASEQRSTVLFCLLYWNIWARGESIRIFLVTQKIRLY